MVLLAALNALPAIAVEPQRTINELQTTSTTPKLIIGITVDQLRSDYLNILQNRLKQGGFRRLMQEGMLIDQVTFELDHPDATTAIAALATGSYPFQNGISSKNVLDPQTLRNRSIFFDFQYIGNATDGYWSPRALLSSTLADEL